MWRFLGNCTQMGGDRLDHLTRGWAWLAAAMELEGRGRVPQGPAVPADPRDPDLEGVQRG